MSLTTTVTAMAQAGCTAQQIAAVVEAHEAAVESQRAQKRAKDAERQRKSRMSRNVTVTQCDSDGQRVTPPALNDPLPNLDRTEVSLNPPPYSPPAIENSDLGFGGFWSAYPKRSGTNSRKNAETRFRAAVKSGCDPETIIDGARRYAEHCDVTGKTNTEFVKAAEAWLNGRLWECSYSITEARPPPHRQAKRNTGLEGLQEIFERTQGNEHQQTLRIAG